MKTKNIYILLLMVVAAFSSCKEDLTDTGEPYFALKDATEATSPTGLSIDFSGNKTGQQYVIRSNRSWEIVAASENDWVKFFPNEGDDDGIVRLIVSENKTFVDRQMIFTYVVDGEEQTTGFTVNQAAATPYITVSDIAGKSLSQLAQSFDINVQANVDYTFSSSESWLTLEKTSKGATTTTLTFAATANTGMNSRSANVTFTCAEFPALNQTLVVTQEGKGEGTVVLSENFDWLTYSNVVIPSTSSDAVRYDKWTAVEKARGWSSSVNTVSGSGSTPLLYACKGFVKIGKTSYGGDLISPKLSGLTGTTNVVVKFKAVPYRTLSTFNTDGSVKEGTKDDNILNIIITGGGTASQTRFVIDNWPNYFAGAAADELISISNAMWAAPDAERSFTIVGATPDTQITFLGNAYDLTTATVNKNRLCLDDIKVLIPN